MVWCFGFGSMEGVFCGFSVCVAEIKKEILLVFVLGFMLDSALLYDDQTCVI